MRRAWFIAALLLSCSGLFAAEIWNSTMPHENRLRKFKVFVPSSYSGLPMPLVVVLHGEGGGIKQITGYTHFSRLAEKEGFMVAYPQGTGGQWNDGRVEMNINDRGFIVLMIAAIKARYALDESRIYVCGMSSGGFMSMRLACELPAIFAAAGAVCAGLTPYLIKNSVPAENISILIMNGTRDPIVPFEGGNIKSGKKTRGQVLSAVNTIRYWYSWSGCGGRPKFTTMNMDCSDKTEVEKYRYDCGGTEIVLYKVAGGGHTWPGAAQYLPEDIIGRTSRDIDATEELWDFFKRHRK